MSYTTPHPPELHTLYSQHHGWLQAWLRGKLGNNSDAADIAHDTFLRILVARNAAAIQQPREYLATIARGLVTDRFRRLAIERAYLDTLAARPEPEAISPETRSIILETLVAIDRMLDQMGTRPREIFMLVQFEGLTYAEVGEKLGISITTVKKHLVKALTQCLMLSAE